MWRKGVGFQVAAWVCVLGSGLAHAGDPKVGFTYDADATCPNAIAFRALVLQKAAGVDLVETAEARPDVVVHIKPRGAGYAGSLEIQRPNQTKYVREITGASCEEISPALAFVLALALSGHETSAAAPPAAALAPMTTAPDAPVLPAPQPETEPTWGWTLGAQLGLRTGVAPVWSPLEAGFGELRQLRASPFAATVRGSIVHAEPVTREDRAGATRFTWIAGRLEGCPARIHLLPSVEVVPCLGTHIGAIGSSGSVSSQKGQGKDASSIWMDAVAALRLELRVIRFVSIQAQGDVLVPLEKHQFFFENPDTPVYEVPSVAAGGLVSLAVQIP